MSSQLNHKSIKVGDTLGLWKYRLLLSQDIDDPSLNVPFPIPVGTTVAIRMVNSKSGDVAIADAAAFIFDAAEGIVAYQRLAADVAAAGVFNVQWTVDPPGGDEHKSPNIQQVIAVAL